MQSDWCERFTTQSQYEGKMSKKSRQSVEALLALALLFLSQTAAFAEDMSWPSADDSSSRQTTLGVDADKNTGQQVGVQEGEAAKEGSLGKVAPETAAPEPVSQSPSKKRGTTTLVGSAKSAMLYGRIDQIASQTNVSMPVFKVEKARFDTSRGEPLHGSASEAHFSGGVTRSFPMDFSGSWGGQLKVWRYSVSSLSERIDPAETNKLERILRPGTSGNVNFTFEHDMAGSIDLEPASVRIMIPATESYSYQQMASNPQMAGLGGMVSQMMANMKVPVILHFGTISTGGALMGVSGNKIDQVVVKNVIRQLAPDVLEQQIITRDSSIVAGTGVANQGYTESVLRFTRRSATDLYVLAASVDYSSSGGFLRKLIMYGDVLRGQSVNTSPYPTEYGNLSSMLQGANGSGSAAGLSSLLSGLGGAGAMNTSSLNQYASNPAVQNYMNGGGAMGQHLNGFSQVLNSLNMMSR